LREYQLLCIFTGLLTVIRKALEKFIYFTHLSAVQTAAMCCSSNRRLGHCRDGLPVTVHGILLLR